MNKHRIGIWIMLSVITLSISACVIGSAQQPAVVALPTATATAGSQAAQAGSVAQAQDLAASQGTFEQIYQQVNPSVVNIRVSVPAQPSQVPFQFFGQQVPGQSQPEQQGLGSGFVLDTEGHIVTNNHVIENADSISVTFQDGTTVPATVVGADPDSDLAEGRECLCRTPAACHLCRFNSGASWAAGNCYRQPLWVGRHHDAGDHQRAGACTACRVE